MKSFERFGFGLGIVCAIHCVLTPIAIAALPLLSVSWSFPEYVEWGLSGAMVLVAAVGAWRTYGDCGSFLRASAYPIAVLLMGVGMWMGHEGWAGRIVTSLGAIGMSVLILRQARHLAKGHDCVSHESVETTGQG
jgi:hypothetical protein